MPFQKGHKINNGRKRSEMTRMRGSQAKMGDNNPMYGRRHSLETIEKMRQVKLNNNNPNWKGDDVGIGKLHYRIIKLLPKPKECPECGKKMKLELCNVSPTYNPDTYNMDLKNWYYSCRKCHMNSDGRMKNLKQFMPYEFPTEYKVDPPFKFDITLG